MRLIIFVDSMWMSLKFNTFPFARTIPDMINSDDVSPFGTFENRWETVSPFLFLLIQIIGTSRDEVYVQHY